MIHVERKTIVINGNGAVICCEIESILREFRKSVEEKHGKEAAKELIDKIVENSKKTDEQNEKRDRRTKEASFRYVSEYFKVGYGRIR